MTVQAQITMQANINTPPYTLVMWTCYGEPDNTGAQSGYFGQLDPNSIKVNSIVYNNSTQNPLTLTVGGDLTGSLPNPTVVGLQGNAISSTSPTTGQVLTWNGTWIPANGVSAGNGLTETSNSLSVNSSITWTTPISLLTSSASGATINASAGAITLTSSGALNLSANSIVINNASTISFNSSTNMPIFTQTSLAANSGNGQTMTIQAQNCTGTTSTGGSLNLNAGSGTSGYGSVICKGNIVALQNSLGNPIIEIAGTTIGFYGITPQSQVNVSGSSSGATATVLKTLCNALAAMGLITGTVT
jgi:trimeric autotransporter adhesin